MLQEIDTGGSVGSTLSGALTASREEQMQIRKYVTKGDETYVVTFDSLIVGIQNDNGNHVMSMTYNAAANTLVDDALRQYPKRDRD